MMVRTSILLAVSMIALFSPSSLMSQIIQKPSVSAKLTINPDNGVVYQDGQNVTITATASVENSGALLIGSTVGVMLSRFSTEKQEWIKVTEANSTVHLIPRRSTRVVGPATLSVENFPAGVYAIEATVIAGFVDDGGENILNGEKIAKRIHYIVVEAKK